MRHAPGDKAQHLISCRNGVSFTPNQFDGLKRFCRKLASRPLFDCRVIQLIVVKHNRPSIARNLHVKFDAIAVVNCSAKGRKAVFCSSLCNFMQAAMS